MIANRKGRPNQPKIGFTLIETVIAIGIVATGLLAIIATAGTAVTRVGTLAERDAALRLRSTLLEAFHDPNRFSEIYAAVREEVPVYAYCYGAEFKGGGGIDAIQDTSFELAPHHINGFRLSTDENFDAEVAASPGVFRVQIRFFDVATGEVIETSTLPEDPFEFPALRFPAVIKLFVVRSSQVEAGNPGFSGRPLTTFTAVLKP